MAILGLAIGAGRWSRADIVLDPGALYEDRLGFVIDGASQQLHLAYDHFVVTPFHDDTPRTDGGTSKYSNSMVAVSNTNAGTVSGTSFDLRSTASAAILQPGALFAFAHAYNEYVAYFHVTSSQTFIPSVDLTATANLSGSGQSFEFLAQAYLYDLTANQVLYDGNYLFDFGLKPFAGSSAPVSLVAGHHYELIGESFVFAEVSNPLGTQIGSVSGEAEARFGLTAVPEPSTLAIAGLGALGLAGHARRRLRSAR